MRSVTARGGMVALVDSDGDGRADKRQYFGDESGTGIALHDGYLYYSSETAVKRLRLGNTPVPDSVPETMVSGFPEQGQHASKPMTFDTGGNMYVNVGAPSNACQKRSRTKGSPGQRPCPQLKLQAGIWRFEAGKTGQLHCRDGEQFATGIRNALALDWNREADALYFAMHGRDQLHQLFPELYSVEDNAELPAEEFHRAEAGIDHGWPYTYWDGQRAGRMVAPEYGGDGQRRVEDGRYRAPLASFPGHWAPNDLLFYSGDNFPAFFRRGAFIAFHGSWNRAPLPQAGFNVAFIPMDAGGDVTGDWIVFADGFKGTDRLMSPGGAAHRPTGLAVGPDGALYVADDAAGRIWKITYRGGESG